MPFELPPPPSSSFESRGSILWGHRRQFAFLKVKNLREWQIARLKLFFLVGWIPHLFKFAYKLFELFQGEHAWCPPKAEACHFSFPAPNPRARKCLVTQERFMRSIICRFHVATDWNKNHRTMIWLAGAKPRVLTLCSRCFTTSWISQESCRVF